jgi:hypothetical protein
VAKLNERQRLGVTIGIVVLLAGGMTALIYKERSEIDAIEQEIASLDTRIRSADVEIRKTKDREDRVLVFRAVEGRELAVLPTKQKIAEFHNSLATFLTQAGVRFRELPESTAVESELAKGIYVTRNVLSVTGDAASILRFVNTIENDPRLVAVKGLRVTAGEHDLTAPTQHVEHDVELHLETYFYNPEDALRERIHVPNAERRLEEGDLRNAIASFQPERQDTYVLRPASSRRDAYVDPRQVRQKEDPEALRELLAQQEPIVIDLENRLRDIHERKEQEDALAQAGDLFRYDRMQAETDVVINELQVRLSQTDMMKTVTLPILQGRLEEVRVGMNALRGQRAPREMTVTRSVAEKTLEEVQKWFAAGEFAKVTSEATAWQTFLRDKQVNADAVPVVDEIARFRARAKTLADFFAIQITVTGTIVNPIDPARSVALVNGRSVRTGDKLETDVVVGRILQDAVEFSYGEETIRLKREDGGDAKRTPTRGAGPSVPARPRR